MEYPVENNRLLDFRKLGFAVTWSLISFGLDYDEMYNLNLNLIDVVDFCKIVVGLKSDHQNEIIQIICEEDDLACVKKKVIEFSKNQENQFDINARKWRAFILYEKLFEQHVFNLVDLYDFWLTFGDVKPVPEFYPYNAVTFLSQEKRK